MKNLTLSALGMKARDSFCRCGSGSSTGSSCSREATSGRSFDLAAAKQASVSKLARILGEEVKCDDKVVFDYCVVSHSRRNAFANIFCGLPSKGLRRLFAVYGIDEVQTKAPYQPLDLDEEARRERLLVQLRRRSRADDADAAGTSGHSRCCQHHHHHHQQQQQHHHHRAHSALDASRRRLPAFAVEVRLETSTVRHSHAC